MKKFEVEILRKASYNSQWYLSKIIIIEGRSSNSVLNKVEKQYASPYCTIGKIKEAK